MSTRLLSSARTPLRILLADDEPVARRGVRLLLEKESDVIVVGEASDGLEAVEMIAGQRPDVVLLDVQMPEADGFEVIRRIGVEAMPVVVFLTAYDEFALRAFDVHAVDYLLKPYEDARFQAALARAREAVRRRRSEQTDERIAQLMSLLEKVPGAEHAAGANPPAPFSERILIKSSGEIFFLKAEEIDWIEAEGDYMKFHVGGKAHLLRDTMARLEARLDPARFIRIHRSTIVNIDRVRKLSPTFVGDYAVFLHDGTKLKLSRGYQDRLQQVLKNAL